jgi:carbon-monoxide dehydrogenase iron sulfur subunit
MIIFSKEKCFGCHLCEVACSGVRLGEFNPKMANIHITFDYVGDMQEIKCRVCDLCGECENVCPVKAISKQDGAYKVDNDICTLCMACVEACPQNVISVKEEKPIICNLCSECVSWCPRGALVFEGGN